MIDDCHYPGERAIYIIAQVSTQIREDGWHYFLEVILSSVQWTPGPLVIDVYYHWYSLDLGTDMPDCSAFDEEEIPHNSSDDYDGLGGTPICNSPPTVTVSLA
jgi:hypothetical protein